MNRFPSRVSYILNQRPDLACLESATFDLVFTDIVLQHIRPADARAYIAEFIRVLRPGGIAVFQLPSTPRPPEERTTMPVPMPGDAYRTTITPAAANLEGLGPGVMRDCAVAIRNVSSIDWDQRQSGLIRIGNHWLAPDGTMLIQDDGRASLPTVLAAGSETTLVLPVTAPREPGRYLCEFDLVHELCSWFADRGSRTARVPVIVGAPSGTGFHGSATDGGAPAYPEIEEMLPASDPAEEIGEFPMHGIPKDDVLQLLGTAGAEPFHIEPDERGGPEWVGYRYFVQRT